MYKLQHLQLIFLQINDYTDIAEIPEMRHLLKAIKWFSCSSGFFVEYIVYGLFFVDGGSRTALNAINCIANVSMIDYTFSHLLSLALMKPNVAIGTNDQPFSCRV